MNLHFRPLSVAEIPAACQLLDDAYTRQLKRLFGNSPRGRWPSFPPEKMQAYVQREQEGVRVGLLKDEIVTLNICRAFGHLGWFHSLAVRPALQGRGLGRQAVADGERHLQSLGVTLIGLMTWPSALGNVGFYHRLGYQAAGLSAHAYRRAHIPLTTGASLLDAIMLSRLFGSTRERAELAAAELCHSLFPGLDYTPWLRWTVKQRLGDVMLLGRGEQLVALALCHTRRQSDWLEGKLLLMHPDLGEEERLWVLEHVRRWAAREHRGSYGFPLDLFDRATTALLLRHHFRLFGDSMLQMFKGALPARRGVHLVRFSG